MNKSKASIIVSQIIEKIEKIGGLCWAGFWALGALIYMFDDADYGAWIIVFAWVMCAIGVVAFIAGKRRTKMRLEFKKYVMQLSIDPSGALENLASATATSVDVVKKNLQFMIKKKFFTNAFINEQANQLVLPSVSQRAQQQTQVSQSGSAQLGSVVCTCSCCGGMNKVVKGTTGECDFCGSPLQG